MLKKKIEHGHQAMLKMTGCQAITIEVSNSSTGGNWPVSATAWKSLVNLCVDICKRYNFRLTYDGTKTEV